MLTNRQTFVLGNYASVYRHAQCPLPVHSGLTASLRRIHPCAGNSVFQRRFPCTVFRNNAGDLDWAQSCDACDVLAPVRSL